ncbi:hypothetical protein IFM89_006221 [Coptis chinensis]|uniref:Chloride channel protein n=1 Tax=Coptis chinensis TaxID=261450 RepID=A0A835H922_9MAGN|nr:hypothetical protein IFM89_006221 [Coptis chinensis]
MDSLVFTSDFVKATKSEDTIPESGNSITLVKEDKEFLEKKKKLHDLERQLSNAFKQNDAIRNLFSAKTFHEYSAQSLLTFLVTFYTLAVVTFGTAVPAGQFVPGIMIGSTYGRLVGMFVVNFYKTSTLKRERQHDVIVVLASQHLHYAMINLQPKYGRIYIRRRVCFTWCCFFSWGFNEDDSPLEGHTIARVQPKYHMRKMTAREACKRQKVVSFPRVVKVADLVSILRNNKHNGFPVVDHGRNGEALVIGLILRSHLLVLQSKIDFQHSPSACDLGAGSVPIRHNFGEFVKPASSKGLSIDDI